MCDMDAVKAFRQRALNPEQPVMRGSHENGDIFFQHREACNSYYNAVPAIVEEYMDKVNAKLGTDYTLFTTTALLMQTALSLRWAPSATLQKKSLIT